MTVKPHTPMRRTTRLTTIVVICLLIFVGLIGTIWFAAPGLLARRAAHRVTIESDQLRIDHAPIVGDVSLFDSNTQTGKVSQRQLRMAFRGAAGTLESQLGRPAMVIITQDKEGWNRLCAYWQFVNGYVEMQTGSGKDSDWTQMHAAAGKRLPDENPKEAKIEDVTTIYVR